MTSTIKVNNIQNQCGQNIINENSNTITIGASGDTIALASGASQTGFGRTGAVNWQTTKKTATFTATSGEGYFCDTSSGAFTLNLPSSPSAGDIVGLKDYASSFADNNLTLGRGGSPLNGSASDGTLDTNNLSLTLVYVDGTEGWIPVEEGTGFIGETFITATGGNAVVTCGNFKTHIFTGPGTFAVSALSASSPNNVVDYLVVAGGGGSTINGGGAGAGGFRTFASVPGTNSPLNAPAGLTITTGNFPITVGAGGTNGAPSGWPSRAPSPNGNTSTFSTITSAGGGGVNTQGTCSGNGKPGGSGGGGGYSAGTGGTGNTPPTSPAQGNNGGTATASPGSPYFAGGGGAGAAGNGGTNPNAGGAGSFIQTGFIGPTAPSYGETGPAGRYFSGGGGGSNQAPSSPYPTADIEGGLGGGGNGAAAPEQAGNNGTANTGGGAGTGNGGSSPGGAAGGSGIVMIRYKFQ